MHSLWNGREGGWERKKKVVVMLNLLDEVLAEGLLKPWGSSCLSLS